MTCCDSPGGKKTTYSEANNIRERGHSAGVGWLGCGCQLEPRCPLPPRAQLTGEKPSSTQCEEPSGNLTAQQWPAVGAQMSCHRQDRDRSLSPKLVLGAEENLH